MNQGTKTFATSDKVSFPKFGERLKEIAPDLAAIAHEKLGLDAPMQAYLRGDIVTVLFPDAGIAEHDRTEALMDALMAKFAGTPHSITKDREGYKRGDSWQHCFMLRMNVNDYGALGGTLVCEDTKRSWNSR